MLNTLATFTLIFKDLKLGFPPFPPAHHWATTTVQTPGFKQAVFFIPEQVNSLNFRIREIILP